ncbi:9614_t:CDS:2 [Entrophospora sp. SA101]|nr:9614_t:CDS:2 [Entrophospora sp. SA101]
MLTKFNQAYSELIGKLPPSLENEAWKHLISRKRNPITEEDASTINPLIELFLNHEIIQQAWRNFKKRPESLASKVWNGIRNDNISNDKKFLGLTRHKVKNAQTRDQFNLWKAEQIEMYRKCNSDMIRLFLDRKYEEYYIPYDWIGSKKNQLYERL